MPPILNSSYEMYYPALVPLGYRLLTLAVAYLGKTATTWQYCAGSPTTSSKMTRPHCVCCSISLTCPLRMMSRRPANAVLEQMRRIGMKRFLFGSDFNVLTPLQEVKDIEKLRLIKEELRTLQQNCAPWVCS
jgi:hypothetical protein